MADSHVLVTGGAGFIGSHLVDALLERGDRVTVLDRLSAGGSLANISGHEANARMSFIRGDVCDPEVVGRLVREVDAVVHAAAETHVDRSIEEPAAFLTTNVLGTESVLEAVRRHGTRMLMISTDEVYGAGDPAGGLFDEDAPLRPRSPYAASKAAADLLCAASVTTYDAPVVLVRGTNAFGPRQIERVVPTFAVNALRGSPVPVYARGEQRREFLYVGDWVLAALTVLDHGRTGVVYNIGEGHELSNAELARRICELAGADPELIEFVADRPGHDFRYGVRSDRLRALGWRPGWEFDEALAHTIEWYRDNLDSLEGAHEVPVVTAPRAVGGRA
ncbi:MAG: dTDP-glucose 4,6-dehydratase [Actinomycetota bacterium]|nr:dTDP-glucose 4,6-dehydratase [Actinomycetota bacterium]MDH5224022.1 dTDP-glucose 4,6-dehydratase [Actinomycetota bacterium]MDH5313908.1 dTDP-glucose 4,6-dehydratase [Actinomycetota bacterium]